MHMTEVETHKARKAHRCEWCWQRIDEGAEYKRYRYYDGGEAATIKMHPECMGAMQDEAAEWGGDFEWTPGQERPKVGAGETAHDWKCVSPGEYDTLYECAKCGARHMEQADRPGSERPKFGCTHNAELRGAKPIGEASSSNDVLETGD